MSESSAIGVTVSIVLAIFIYCNIWAIALEETESRHQWKRVISYAWILGHVVVALWMLGSWFFQSWVELLAIQ